MRDDDPIDATLEGAPIPDDTGESSEVLWASTEAPGVVPRGAPPPVTLPDMPPIPDIPPMPDMPPIPDIPDIPPMPGCPL